MVFPKQVLPYRTIFLVHRTILGTFLSKGFFLILLSMVNISHFGSVVGSGGVTSEPGALPPNALIHISPQLTDEQEQEQEQEG